MKDTLFQPIPWTRVVLAILPGVWLALQRREVDADVPTFFGAAAGTALIALALLLLSRLVERRLAVWSLPVFGGVAWQGASFLQQSFQAGQSHLIGPFWFVLPLFVAVAMTVVSTIGLLPYWIYRCLRMRMPGRGWALAALVVVLVIVNSHSWFNELGRFFAAFQLLALMIPVAIASLLMKKHGLLAALLVVACEPVWIELLVTPSGYSLYDLFQGRPVAVTDYGTLRSASAILAHIPFLVFLILIPIALLRSRTKTGQVVWLLVPSLITLVVLNLLPAWALAGTASQYSFPQWGQAVLAAVLLWLPLALSVVIADSVRADSEVAIGNAVA